MMITKEGDYHLAEMPERARTLHLPNLPTFRALRS